MMATKKQHYLVFEDDEFLTKMLKSLNQLRKNSQFCDITLQVGSCQDTLEIPAHRAVLASASPYLFDLFANDPKGGNVCQFKLNGNFDREAFEKLVDYAYTARLEVPKDKIKAVYMAAYRLRMHAAAKQCANALADSLTPDNCIGIRSIPGLSNDADLLYKVDCYIKNHVDDIVRSKQLGTLPRIQIELLQNSNEEIDATNPKHLCDMVLDWMRRSFELDNIPLDTLTKKMHMLYLNPDHTLHDCNDIENGTVQDSELIQDYKKLSRRMSSSANSRSNRKPTPAKPRQFLYTRSDSSSSLDSLTEEDDKDWKLIAVAGTGEHSIMGIVMASGRLSVLSVLQRLHTPVTSPASSRNTSVEKQDAYTIVPPMSSARSAVGTADLNGKLLVCGGYDRGECLKTTEIYDQVTNKWTSLKPMHTPRARFDITVVDNKVYAIGGCDGTRELNSAEVLDSSTMVWKRLPPLPMVRSNAGVCSLDNKIYVIGGLTGQRGIASCDVYDPQSQDWVSIAPLLVGRYQAGVATMNGDVYAVGGCDSWNCLATVEKYCPTTDKWVSVAAMNIPRRGCGVAVYNGKLYAVGGHDGVHSLCSVEMYDPQTNTWSPGPALTSCRANVGVTVVANRLYAVGGFNGKIFLNTVEFLDAQTNEWTTFVSKMSADLVNGSVPVSPPVPVVPAQASDS